MEGERPLVLLDLDGVLFRLPWHLSSNFRYKKIPAAKPISKKGGGVKKLLRYLYWHPFLWGKPLRRINWSVVEAISLSREYSFVAVTNRPPHLREATERLLSQAVLADLPVRYNETGVSPAYLKFEAACNPRVRFFVEDDASIADFLASQGINVVLIDRWYNRDYKIRSPLVIRVREERLGHFLK